MSIKDIFKVSGKTFFNPSAWFGYDEVKGHTKIIWAVIQGLIYPAQSERSETFDEALERLNLTHADANRTARNYYIFAVFFVVCGFSAIVFGLYISKLYHTVSAFFLALAVAALFLSQAFRYHFWFFQIKHRQLGCTFQEWLRGRPYTDRNAKP